MSATFIQDGASIDYTPGTAVVAGDVVVQGNLVGVAKHAIAANELGAVAISGVFDFNKVAATAINTGTDVYWDATPGEATDISTANTLIGKCVKDAAGGDATVRVKMLP